LFDCVCCSGDALKHEVPLDEISKRSIRKPKPLEIRVKNATVLRKYPDVDVSFIILILYFVLNIYI
jgi:hypothetical protein